jgi:hypothetical protein|eukprot:COSAG01_NODE_131_length_24907_cov_19.802201_21_plen_33_part_00
MIVMGGMNPDSTEVLPCADAYCFDLLGDVQEL